MVPDLHYLDAKDIMTLAHMQEQIEMNKRKEYLAQHKYPIWQGKMTNSGIHIYRTKQKKTIAGRLKGKIWKVFRMPCANFMRIN